VTYARNQQFVLILRPTTCGISFFGVTFSVDVLQSAIQTANFEELNLLFGYSEIRGQLYICIYHLYKQKPNWLSPVGCSSLSIQYLFYMSLCHL